MGGVLRGTGSILLAVAIALAWPWTNLLKDTGYMNDTGRVLILLGLTGVLVVQQTYLVLPRPISNSIIDARRPITERYLESLLGRYYQELQNLGVSDPYPTVRVNIMLVTKKWKGVLGTYLKIYYVRCPDGVVYRPEEIALKWKRKQGTAGWAWENKQPTPYDSIDENLQSPAYGLTSHQQDVVGSQKSTLSVPILYEGDVVGVLNMDSGENVPRTKFSQSSVTTIASEAAKIVSGQFDPKGVAA